MTPRKWFHKPFKGFMAYEWQFGPIIIQFCHNDNWNWRKYGTVWRLHVWRDRYWRI